MDALLEHFTRAKASLEAARAQKPPLEIAALISCAVHFLDSGIERLAGKPEPDPRPVQRRD